jgi:hypothetical protein
MEAVAAIGECLLGIAAVDRVACEAGRVAQVLSPTRAVRAVSTGMSHPRHADSIAYAEPIDACSDTRHYADYLVAWDDRHLRMSEFAVDHVQVRATDAARSYVDQ